jgi:Glycosyl transferase family 2
MFTYCLVTRGRKDYLPQTLNSLGEALVNPDVQVVIIDNGCEQDVTQMLTAWCNSFTSRANYIRFSVNETSAGRVWEALRDYKIDWICFPGDDDIVNSEFLTSARTAISQNSNLVAIAASMQIIDSAGIVTGEVRQPTMWDSNSAQYLARAFHEPPFMFPSLFLKFNAIQDAVPPSRFILDWWISLNLICRGDIATSTTPSLFYRVHPGQESSLAPNRRKYFEAQIIIGRFVDSELFVNSLKKISDEALLTFWVSLYSQQPIYGDAEFGRPLLTKIGLRAADIATDINTTNQILADLAAMNGVLLRSGEVKAFRHASVNSAHSSFGNFQLAIARESCAQLHKFLGVESQKTSGTLVFSVGCKHSNSEYQFFVPCDAPSMNPSDALDILISQITQNLESSGVLEFKITPIERKVVRSLRSLKKLVPYKFISFSKNRIHRAGGKL